MDRPKSQLLWAPIIRGFQLDVLCHRCRKISMALRDKQRQTHSGTFIDNINSFLSYDFWIFLKPSLKGFQSCLHFVRSNGEDFNWLGILKIKQDRFPKLMRLRKSQSKSAQQLKIALVTICMLCQGRIYQRVK